MGDLIKGELVRIPAQFLCLQGQQNEDAAVLVVEANGKASTLCVLRDLVVPMRQSEALSGLIEPLRLAEAFIAAERADYIDCACLHDAEGNALLDTMDDADRLTLDTIDALLDNIRAALAKVAP